MSVLYGNIFYYIKILHKNIRILKLTHICKNGTLDFWILQVSVLFCFLWFLIMMNEWKLENMGKNSHSYWTIIVMKSYNSLKYSPIFPI